jgi:hypothetical protein
MTGRHYICLLATLGAVITTGAGDFPLTFKTIPAKDVMSFAGSSGTYGMLRLQKPAVLKKETKAISRHPLYGQCREGRTETGFLFRLDESKGDGKGYDRLIVDMNRNGDLTDDPVVERAVVRGESKGTRSDRELFGPIQAPQGEKIAGGRPVYFAEAYIFNAELIRNEQATRSAAFMVGQLRFKAGWYLEATVQLDGMKRMMGVYDGDSNLRLGDAPQTLTMTNRGVNLWYFVGGDNLLVDADGSGSFDNDVFQSESCAFAPILYMGAKPYRVALSPDNTSLQVEPWTETLAEVAVVPHGDQVHSVTLACERSAGQWQLIRAGTADGAVKVPPGNYRLYACELLGKAAAREQVMASAYQRNLQKPVSFSAGKGNSLRCGPPLEIKVTAERARPPTMGLVAEESRGTKADSEFNLSINAEVFGQGGEAYFTYRKGEKFRDQPAKPTFRVADARGKKVKDGNLEFG